MPSKHIVLAGGSGFVGQALAESLLADGCEVHVLSRGESPAILGKVIAWDGETVGPWAESLEDVAAVINLTGKNINCRPTQANLCEIVRSRVASVCAVGEAVRRCRKPPRVFVQTTAVGIYGDSGDLICDESTPPGGGFLGETCKAWETAFDESPTPGVRRVVLRLGLVLGAAAAHCRCFPSSPAGSSVAPPAAAGNSLAGCIWLTPCGSIVRQSIATTCKAFTWPPRRSRSLTPSSCAPCAALHRPWSPPAPALTLRVAGWIMGINAELALTGQRCISRRLKEQGFSFEFAELGAALRELSTQYTIPST